MVKFKIVFAKAASIRSAILIDEAGPQAFCVRCDKLISAYQALIIGTCLWVLYNFLDPTPDST